MTARRVALQLTPLLDLLLIVIFAQYLDIGERDRQRVAATDVMRNEVAALRVQAEVTAVDLELARLSATNAERELAHATASLQALGQQQQQVVRATADAFQVSPDRLAAILEPLATDGIATEQDRMSAVARLRQVTSGSNAAVLRHLLTHEELRKRVDVWTLHLGADESAVLIAGGQTATVRADSPVFESKLTRIVDSLPEPKRLVVVLLTYDGRTRLKSIEAIRGQLPGLMQKFAENSDSRFEYSDLGFLGSDGTYVTPIAPAQ